MLMRKVRKRQNSLCDDKSSYLYGSIFMNVASLFAHKNEHRADSVFVMPASTMIPIGPTMFHSSLLINPVSPHFFTRQVRNAA